MSSALSCFFAITKYHKVLLILTEIDFVKKKMKLKRVEHMDGERTTQKELRHSVEKKFRNVFG
jgi:hypothetical protein